MVPLPAPGPDGARVFALTESRELGLRICAEAHVPLAPLEDRRFEGGEFKLRPLESVRDLDVFVVQTLAGTPHAPISDRLVRLLFLLAGLRDAGAARLTAVVPYFAFARKDRRTQLRDPVNARYVAQLLEAAGAARVFALDVHNPAALDNAFRIPVDHFTALPMMVDHFARAIGEAPVAVASPDVGGIKRAQLFREQLAERLHRPVELVFVEKRRALGAVSGGTLVGPAGGRTVIVIDDLCATGGTLIRAAESCREAGAAEVRVAVTHAPTPQGIAAVQASDAIREIVITDSTGESAHAEPSSAGGRLTVLPATQLLGQALRRVLSGRPVAPLLTHWPAEG